MNFSLTYQLYAIASKNCLTLLTLEIVMSVSSYNGVAESVMIFKWLFTKELGFKFHIHLYFIMESATPL